MSRTLPLPPLLAYITLPDVLVYSSDPKRTSLWRGDAH